MLSSSLLLCNAYAMRMRCDAMRCETQTIFRTLVNKRESFVAGNDNTIRSGENINNNDDDD